MLLYLGMDLASVACFGICIGSFPELRTYIGMGRTPFSPYLKLNITICVTKKCKMSSYYFKFSRRNYDE